MLSFEQTAALVQQSFESGSPHEVESVLDGLAAGDLEELAEHWGISDGEVSFFLSAYYNNVGMMYRRQGMQGNAQGDNDALMQAVAHAERCHEKALDMYDMPAESLVYLPSGSPLSKNALMICWGLGGAKFALGKWDESRNYLEICLGIPADDPQAAAWQREANEFLRSLPPSP